MMVERRRPELPKGAGRYDRGLGVIILEPDNSKMKPLWIAPSADSSNCWFRKEKAELILSYPDQNNSPCLPCSHRDSLDDGGCSIGRVAGFLFDVEEKRSTVHRICTYPMDELFKYAATGRRGDKVFLSPITDLVKVREVDMEGDEDYSPTRSRRIQEMNTWLIENISRTQEMVPEPYAAHLAPLVTNLTAHVLGRKSTTRPKGGKDN